MGAFDGLAAALGNLGYQGQQLAGGVAGGVNQGLDVVTGNAYRDSGVEGFLGNTGGQVNNVLGATGAVFVQSAAGAGAQARESSRDAYKAVLLPVVIVGGVVLGGLALLAWAARDAHPFEGGEYHGTAHVSAV